MKDYRIEGSSAGGGQVALRYQVGGHQVSREDFQAAMLSEIAVAGHEIAAVLRLINDSPLVEDASAAVKAALEATKRYVMLDRKEIVKVIEELSPDPFRPTSSQARKGGQDNGL
jgi:hypothetical protein